MDYIENENNETHEAISDSGDGSDLAKRFIVVPGEIIIEGEDYLPGEGTRREGSKIVSSKFGLAEIAGRVINHCNVIVIKKRENEGINNLS